MKETELEKREADNNKRPYLSLLESNNQQETGTTLDNYSTSQEHYDQLDESGTIRVKRARLGATSAATTVVATVSDAENSSETASGGTHNRRLGVKDQSKTWWDQCNSPDFPENEFRAVFHMSRATFNMICHELESAVAMKRLKHHQANPVEKAVAICIWRLATGESFQIMSEKFSIARETCRKWVLVVCSAIKTVLKPKYLQWPKDEDAILSTKSKFESISGIQNVIGSMYTTHVPINGSPKIEPEEYTNWLYTERNDNKITYTITLQGVVDHHGAFTDVSIGEPGSMSDDQVLEKSALYREATSCRRTDAWVVGGKSYSLMDLVLVPYHFQDLTEPQQVFNEKIEVLRMVSKRAFTRLKSRWGCLQKHSDLSLENLAVVLEARCVLHNICEKESEEMGPEIIQYELIDGETVPKEPVRSFNAVEKRNNIANNLLR